MMGKCKDCKHLNKEMSKAIGFLGIKTGYWCSYFGDYRELNCDNCNKFTQRPSFCKKDGDIKCGNCKHIIPNDNRLADFSFKNEFFCSNINAYVKEDCCCTEFSGVVELKKHGLIERCDECRFFRGEEKPTSIFRSEKGLCIDRNEYVKTNNHCSHFERIPTIKKGNADNSCRNCAHLLSETNPQTEKYSIFGKKKYYCKYCNKSVYEDNVCDAIKKTLKVYMGDSIRNCKRCRKNLKNSKNPIFRNQSMCLNIKNKTVSGYGIVEDKWCCDDFEEI